MISAYDHVEHLAELDALAYVERFRRTFGTRDEDAVFLTEAWPAAIADAGLTDIEADELLPHYRLALRIKTRKLIGNID